MKIEKKVLGEVIKVLGKVVCTSSADLALRSVWFVGGDNKVSAMASDGENVVSLDIDCVYDGSVEFAVELKVLRELVRSTKEKSVELSGEYLDFSNNIIVPDNAIELAIPEDFVEALRLTAPVVDKQSTRTMLRGINLSCNGAVATDGKQILNVPLNLGLQNDFTIPFPLALLTANPSGGGMLNFWYDGDDLKFRIEIDTFVWYGKGLAGNFPNWTQVIPNIKTLNYSVTFAKTEELTTFLKAVPDSELNAIEINVTPQGVSVIPHDYSHMEYKGEATFEGVKPREVLAINRKILLQMLQQGFNQFHAHSDGRVPVIAHGGKGQYVVMPIRIPSSITQKEIKVNTEDTKVVAQETEPVAVLNPLDELNSNVEEFRNRLKLLFEESTSLIRKVKEVSILQKQKEREFVQARRAIERIKMAI